MKHLFLLFFLPLFGIGQTLEIKKPIRFLALGDSYTIGQSVSSTERWPAQFRDSLMKRGFVTDTIKIIATTGWRTDQLLTSITNKNLKNDQYTLVSLLIGVNNQYQNSPFSQYKSEFIQLVDSAINYAGGNKNHVFVPSEQFLQAYLRHICLYQLIVYSFLKT